MATEGLRIRPETPADYEDVARIHDAAFGGSAESRIVEAVRGEVEHEVSLVAESAGGLVGHVLFSSVDVRGPRGHASAIALGPVGVDPGRQRGGVGQLLCRAGIEACRRLHQPACFVLGHADYYPRHFGFVPARPHGLYYESEAFDAVFFVLELRPGGLEGLEGEVTYHEAFG